MEHYLREYHTRRILADMVPFEYNNHIYYISSPTAEFKFYAEIVYKNVYERARQDNISMDNIVVILNRRGLWKEEDENYLHNFKEELDKTKIALYENYNNEKKRYIYKKVIFDTMNGIASLNSKRLSMNHLTAEHVAFAAKQRFIIGASILKPNKKRLWNKISDWDKDNRIIDAAFEKLNEDMLSEEEIRDLVKNEPWKTVWSMSNKAHILFRKPVKDLGDEQMNVFIWSIVYDNISKSHEPPPKEIVEDDDALDGWILLQKRKREESEGKKEVIGMIDKNLAKYEEIFIIPQNESQIKKIQDLNNFQAKIAFKKKMMQVQQQGQVDEVNLVDRREQIIIQSNQLYLQGMRR